MRRLVPGAFVYLFSGIFFFYAFFGFSAFCVASEGSRSLMGGSDVVLSWSLLPVAHILLLGGDTLGWSLG